MSFGNIPISFVVILHIIYYAINKQPVLNFSLMKFIEPEKHQKYTVFIYNKTITESIVRLVDSLVSLHHW